jgi:Domain of unknown function (DU1801)
MAQNKTRATTASVDAYIEAIEDESRRKDCRVLAKLMSTATKRKPVMWGTGIVGFGNYHYRYDSGREGDMCLAGFSSRKGDISVYLVADFPARDELLAALGKHKMAKACLYIRRLGDIDLKVLKQLVAGSVAEVKRRYGRAGRRA